MPIRITTPIEEKTRQSLRVGDQVLISGTAYSARDAAHQRICEALARGEELPLPLQGATIYYMGPSPARAGRAIGSAGPTTSGRMDVFTPTLLEKGMVAMIGKGRRSLAVKEAMKKHGAVYFAAIGGAGALLSQAICRAECVAYEDLGPEAIYRLEFKDFPAFVVIDAEGNDYYEELR
jgi:fumarate hydratase subunit beta